MKSQGLKLGLAAALLAGVAVTAVAASADEEKTFLDGFSAYVAATSDYRYRGISQNSQEFTPQASVNWAGDYGIYAGTWLSKTNWDAYSKNNPSFETDVYVGKHTDLNGTDLNVELYYYSYPDYQDNGGAKASYVELISQLSRTFGKFTATITGAYSPTWSLDGGVGWYGAATISYALKDWLSLSTTVGNQWASHAPSDYTHWDIGATATYKNFAFDLRYVDNSIESKDCRTFWMGTDRACDPTVTATVTYNLSKLF
jgi:uncharacterized protein (TIGR02001 family)